MKYDTQLPIRMDTALREKLAQPARREQRTESDMARLILSRALLKEKVASQSETT